MSSTGDPDGSFGEGGNEDAPTHHPPWPLIDAFWQGRYERKYLVDGDTIDFDRVPRLQFWAGWFGVRDAFRVLSVLNKVSMHATAAQRPLTGAEATALGEHAANSVRKFAWTQPLAFGLAGAATYLGRRTFKFPLYQPKMKAFSPSYFPTRRFHILKGRAASSVWQAARLSAYMAVIWVPTAAVFTSISEVSFAAHAMRDPRLAPLLDQIRHNSKQKTTKQILNRVGVPTPAGTGPVHNTQQTRGGAYQGSQAPQEYGSSDYAAQSSAAFERPGPATESSQSAYPSWPRSTSTQPTPYRGQENASPGIGSRRQDDGDDLFDDGDDDASPVAPSTRRREAQSSPPGSAWDRLRQQARSGAAEWEKGDSSGQEQGWAQLRQDKTRNPKDYNPKTDSYSISKDEEERERRNYEREQAQKDFDALLEAERRGEGNSGNTRGPRR